MNKNKDAQAMPELLNCPMESLKSTFGQRLKFLRENSGQSLQDVASAIGCSKGHLHELEHEASKNPTINIVRALAIHFMVPVASLVETEITAQYRATPQEPGQDVLPEDVQRAIDALDWLHVCLDMSHEEWCDSASWKDDFEAKCVLIGQVLESSLRNSQPAHNAGEVEEIEFQIDRVRGDLRRILGDENQGWHKADKVTEYLTKEGYFKPAPAENSGPVDDKAGMPERAKECARTIQKMAIENPVLFAQQDNLAAWFLAVMKHEADLVQPSSEGVKDLFYCDGGKHADIVDRLRGKVRIPITDGMGPVATSEGSDDDFFERSFPASNSAMEAAEYIEKLRLALIWQTKAKINYDPAACFADKHRISYNETCRMVENSMLPAGPIAALSNSVPDGENTEVGNQRGNEVDVEMIEADLVNAWARTDADEWERENMAFGFAVRYLAKNNMLKGSGRE